MEIKKKESIVNFGGFMKNSEHNLIFLFFKIIIPIVVVLSIGAIYLFEETSSEKKDFMLEKVITLSKIISTMIEYEKEHPTIDSLEFSSKATLNQIKRAFENFSESNTLAFEYLVGERNGSKVDFIAFSSTTKPKSVEYIHNELAIPMKRALEGLSGVDVEYDYSHKKVFSAYTPIENTQWGLVVKQPYTLHITPFKKVINRTLLFLFIVVIILYYILKFYEYKKSELLKISNERFKDLVESTKDWVWEINKDGVYTYSNARIENILGYTPAQVLGKTPLSLMEESERLRVGDIFFTLFNNRQPLVNLENTNIHKNGQRVILLTSGTAFFSLSGDFMGYRGIDKDITERKLREEQIAQLAYFDTLTGVANRRSISLKLEDEISKAIKNQTNASLIFLDLDGFKKINDSLGHEHGDRVLQIVAKRLQETIREGDEVGRVGGDEFVLLIRGGHREKDMYKKYLVTLAERVIESINEPLKIHGKINYIGASLGIAIIPEDGESVLEIMKRADSAMYSAKSLGKNRAIFSDSRS